MEHPFYFLAGPCLSFEAEYSSLATITYSDDSSEFHFFFWTCPKSVKSSF